MKSLKLVSLFSIVIAIGLFSLQLSGKVKKTKASVAKKSTNVRTVATKDSQPVLKIRVVIGDSITEITTVKKEKVYEMKLIHPLREGDHSLSQKDFDYLMGLLADIKTPSNQIKMCQGNYTQVQAGDFDKTGCLLSKTPTAVKLKAFVNLIASVF